MNRPTKSTDRPEFWDAELEQLAGSVTELFSEDLAIEAIGRTFLRARLEHRGVVSFGEMKAALKEELRRLVRPQ